MSSSRKVWYRYAIVYYVQLYSYTQKFLTQHLIAFMFRQVFCASTLGNNIMVYSSTPYVGIAPKKNGGHIKKCTNDTLEMSPLD